MTLPFFSVIIPTYNRAHKLPACIGSVLAQGFPDYEIVIIDNGSTDGTGELIRERYPSDRIRYFWQEGSGSPANPRNQGIRKSRGEWVAFLDSDDLWHPEKLQKVYDQITSAPEADVLCHNERLVTAGESQDTSILVHARKADDLYRSMLMDGNCLSPSATVVRRSLLVDNALFFNEAAEYAIVEDYDLWLRLAAFGANIGFIDDVLGDYIVDGGNMIGDTERLICNLEHLYRDHAYEVQRFDDDKDKIYRQLQAKISLMKAQRDVRLGRYWTALSVAFNALSGNPVYVVNKIFQRIFRN